jgi:hypothetical protein
MVASFSFAFSLSSWAILCSTSGGFQTSFQIFPPPPMSRTLTSLVGPTRLALALANKMWLSAVV